MTKTELRGIYLARHKNLSSAVRSERSLHIAEQFFQRFDLRRIKYLHCFLPIERTGEIDTRLIIKKIRADFSSIKIAVPRVNFATNEIESLRFTSQTELFQNRWQIYEPRSDEKIDAEKIDAVLIPLLCYDERGFRVGYGKGFYDRFLRNCRADCLKIGLSYFAATAQIADVREFDVKLDFCVTPSKVVEFSNDKS